MNFVLFGFIWICPDNSSLIGDRHKRQDLRLSYNSRIIIIQSYTQKPGELTVNTKFLLDKSQQNAGRTGLESLVAMQETKLN